MLIANSKKKMIKKNYILVSIFFLIFTLSFLTPDYGDEYVFRFIWNKNIKVSNTLDIFKGVYHYYMGWSGRILPAFFQYTFLYFGKIVYSIVNSFVFVMILKNTGKILLKYDRKLEIKKKDIILLFFLIWFLIPVFNQDFLGLVSSVNYSWPLLILIYFIINFGKNNKKNILLSFLVGLSNEGTVIFSNIFLLYKALIKKQKIKKEVFISLWISSFILIFSPGNFIRKFHPDSIFTTYSLINRLDAFFKTGRILMFFKILIFSIFILLYYLPVMKQYKKNIIFLYELLGISIVTLVIQILIMPRNEPRAYLIPFHFLIVVIFYLLKKFMKNIEWYLNKIYNTIIIIVLFYSLGNIVPYYLKNNYILEKERKNMIEFYQSKNEKEVLFYDNEEILSKMDNSFRIYEKLFLDYRFFTNEYFSKYYGFNRVYSVPRGNKLLVVELNKENNLENLSFVFEEGRKNSFSQQRIGNQILIVISDDINKVQILGEKEKIKKIKLLEVFKGKTFETLEIGDRLEF